MLVVTVAEDLDELLEDGGMTAIASLGELSRVVIVTIDIPFVLIIRVLGTKDGRTDGAGEMFDVVLAIQSGDVRATQGAAACVTKEIQASEIISLAQGVLSTSVFGVDREEFGCHDLAAVLPIIVRSEV